MTSPLTTPATPAQLAAAGTPIGDAAWVKTVIDAAFADLRLVLGCPDGEAS